MDFFYVMVLAMVCEAIWETIKMAIPGKIENWLDRICVMIIGIFLALESGIDFLKLVGISFKIPYLGAVLTGLLISRGSNFMHDILATINNMQQNTKNK